MCTFGIGMLVLDRNKDWILLGLATICHNDVAITQLHACVAWRAVTKYWHDKIFKHE